jgi:signal transduction histidine kinase/CheY-like chemotaxis protein
MDRHVSAKPAIPPLPEPVLTTVAIRYEHDVVMARQRARQIASLLGFDIHDQVRIATAVSEIARNAFRYVGNGKAEFAIQSSPALSLCIRISDTGTGIARLDEVLSGRYVSQTGMGMGILGARRLMDEFQIYSGPNGTAILLVKHLPARIRELPPGTHQSIAAQLAACPVQDPFEELQRQNQELLRTLEELQGRQTELAQLNKELEDTNRGVVALYSELDERADYLRRASELKTQFLSNMTHEFRTPLNSIISLSRMLLDRIDGELNLEQEKQVRFIQRASNDLSDLVNDLLDLAKVEAGKVTIRPAEFFVEDLFGALRGMLKPLLANNSAVSLIFEDTNHLPPLATDESKISQILRNLISNALKFTEQGEVRIRAGLENDGLVLFIVSDTGIGIQAQDQERVFEEFTQVEGPHQKGKKGTGLGLPLSRKLAALLGGSLTVASRPGKGSTFTLAVPRTFQGSETATNVPAISNDLDPFRIPILVIEDNEETLFMYDKYLKGSGFQPIPAPSVRHARQALERFRPAAIILDVILSRENSWSYLAELKNQPATRDIPILVITVIENGSQASALGAQVFLNKPVERTQLLAELRKAVPEPRETVLIVDDDEASRYVLRTSLSNTRFTVEEASGGGEALQMIRNAAPSVLVLDLLMPDINGFEVLHKLRTSPATASLPVIVHTSKTLSRSEKALLDGQAALCVPKGPSDPGALRGQFRAALAQALNQPLSHHNPYAH